MGCLNQEHRRIEGKVFFLPYTSVATASKGAPSPNTVGTGDTEPKGQRIGS